MYTKVAFCLQKHTEKFFTVLQIVWLQLQYPGKERKKNPEWSNNKMTSFTKIEMHCLRFDVKNLLLLSKEDIFFMSRFMKREK